MNNKQQTALQQLREKIEQLRSDYWDKLCPLSAFDEVAGNLASQISTIDIILKEVESKLELEKQQIVDFYVKGCNDTYGYDEPSDNINYDKIQAEQYYKDIYGE